MDTETNRRIGDFISSVAGMNPRLIKAYVFGSYAKHLDRPDSDIDIAFIIDRLGDDEKFDLQVQLLLLAAKYDARIEPHPISKDDIHSNSPFANEIVRTGIEIEPSHPTGWF
jgi:predicted nucleotidyltransferase